MPSCRDSANQSGKPSHVRANERSAYRSTRLWASVPRPLASPHSCRLRSGELGIDGPNCARHLRATLECVSLNRDVLVNARTDLSALAAGSCSKELRRRARTRSRFRRSDWLRSFGLSAPGTATSSAPRTCFAAVRHTDARANAPHAGHHVVTMERLTLDTNLLQELWKDQPKRDVVERLLALAERGEVEVVVTARINEDIPGGDLASKIGELSELGVGQTGSVTRLGYWVLGRDHLGSDGFIEAQKAAEAELRRRGRTKLPDWRDWDHLHAHFLQGRDVFLTWDKRLLEAAELLSGPFAVTAMTPEDYLESREA